MTRYHATPAGYIPFSPEEEAEFDAMENAFAAEAQNRLALALTDAVQRHIDAMARSRGYDDIVSACSYAAAPNRFQAEGAALVAWRAAVWDACYQIMAEVQAGTRTIPTEAELIAPLPAMVWPV